MIRFLKTEHGLTYNAISAIRKAERVRVLRSRKKFEIRVFPLSSELDQKIHTIVCIFWYTGRMVDILIHSIIEEFQEKKTRKLGAVQQKILLAF